MDMETFMKCYHKKMYFQAQEHSATLLQHLGATGVVGGGGSVSPPAVTPLTLSSVGALANSLSMEKQEED